MKNRRDNGKKTVTYWICKCDCGKQTSVESYSLRKGKTTSCGCFGAEQRRKAATKHGLSKSRLKGIYNNMKSRCHNPNSPKFKNHGGRGIKICEEWLGVDGFKNFVDWSNNNGYSDKLTLDRIDNNGNYKPQNCRWTTTKVQNYNRRNNVLFEIKGEKKSARDWCEEYGININTFFQRAHKGYTGEDLINKNHLRYKYKLN